MNGRSIRSGAVAGAGLVLSHADLAPFVGATGASAVLTDLPVRPRDFSA